MSLSAVNERLHPLLSMRFHTSPTIDMMNMFWVMTDAYLCALTRPCKLQAAARNVSRVLASAVSAHAWTIVQRKVRIFAPTNALSESLRLFWNSAFLIVMVLDGITSKLGDCGPTSKTLHPFQNLCRVERFFSHHCKYRKICRRSEEVLYREFDFTSRATWTLQPELKSMDSEGRQAA